MFTQCKIHADDVDEIQAHTQKVTCLDLGETGRVLVTGGQDRNVNLWAFGNDKCFMVCTTFFFVLNKFNSISTKAIT